MHLLFKYSYNNSLTHNSSCFWRRIKQTWELRVWQTLFFLNILLLTFFLSPAFSLFSFLFNFLLFIYTYIFIIFSKNKWRPLSEDGGSGDVVSESSQNPHRKDTVDMIAKPNKTTVKFFIKVDGKIIASHLKIQIDVVKQVTAAR